MAANLTTGECGGIKKCCISNSVDGTDDDVLWNGREESGNVRRECEEDEGAGC